MQKQKKCGKSIVKAIFGCVGLLGSQDPYSITSCFWEVKDATATCWKETKENKKPSFEFKPEKVFMNPQRYNFRQKYIRPIREFKRIDLEEERELKRIVEKLNRDRTIKKELKPKIESGILIVACSSCGHKQQIELIKPSEYQDFKCENCGYESKINL